jgi:hypothetical protein
MALGLGWTLPGDGGAIGPDDDFTLTGIALGTIVAVGAYHVALALAPEELRHRTRGAVIATGAETYGGGDEDPPRT